MQKCLRERNPPDLEIKRKKKGAASAVTVGFLLQLKADNNNPFMPQTNIKLGPVLQQNV